MTDSEVLVLVFLVNTGSNSEAVGGHLGQESSTLDVFWVVDDGETVGGDVSGDRHELEAQLVDELVLEGVGGGLVSGDSSVDGLGVSGEQLVEGHVQSVDQLDGRGGEVGALAALVGLHDWGPSLHVGEEGGGLWSL